MNVMDHIHATPAHDAAEYGQSEALLLLLKAGADVTLKDMVSEILGAAVSRDIHVAVNLCF